MANFGSGKHRGKPTDFGIEVGPKPLKFSTRVGGCKEFLSPKIGEMIHFDTYLFSGLQAPTGLI